MPASRLRLRFLMPTFAAALACAPVCADVVELAGGGRLVGTVPEDQPRRTLTIDLEGGGLVTIDRGQVTRVATESAAMAEYRKRAPTAPDTVESQWALAEWCQQRRLRDEYRRHLERVVELDPEHAEARSLLGYQQHAGRWLTREQMMTARGMVRYDGDYRTRQEIAILDNAKRVKETGAKWRETLGRWRRNLDSRDPDRSAEALEGFRSLQDPSAGPELAKLLLAEQNAGVRQLLIQAAAQAPSGATVGALTKLALEAADDEVRAVCLEHLARANTPGLAEPFVRALRSKDNVMVNRAGTALGQLRASEATGDLIDALVTEHKFQVGEDSGGQRFSFDGRSGGFSFGGGGAKVVKRRIENRRVLDALVAITGRSFGFDQERWQAWLVSNSVGASIDLRRDL